MSGQVVSRKAAETEKITINLGHVDLGHIDLLVSEGVYANRTDVIRSAIRREIERHADLTRQSLTRRSTELGLRRIERAELEALHARGETLNLRVLGLAVIAPDVSADLARATIASIEVLGSLQAPAEIRQALGERLS